MKLWRYGRPIEILGQRYRLEGVLGSGGMAEVCLAWDERELRQVAIKILKTDSLDKTNAHDQQMLNRFVKEAGQVAGWQHPHILHVYDHTQIEVLGTDTQEMVLFYIVMEYARGGDLQKRMKPGEPYYSLSTAFTIFRQICGAVQYAHKQGVIHRDIKPLNILFRQNRTGPEDAVLSDFGLAVQADASHHTFAEAGTFAYMAPEQFRGQAQPASDIFALGVTLYQLCTGHLPFRREVKELHRVLANSEPDPLPPSMLNPDLPSVLDEPILQALRTNPADRPRSAAAFWNKLAAVLSETKLPSERRVVGQPTVAQLSQPLSLLTAKVDEKDEEEEQESDSDGQATRAAQQLQSPKPIVLQPAPPAPAPPRQRQPAPHPSRAKPQPLLAKRRRFPRLFLSAGIASGLLLLVAVLVTTLPLLFASTTTVTLIPRSQVEQQTATVSANQIQAHQLSATAAAQNNMGNVSGTIPATTAQGTLQFLNNTNHSIVVQTTTFTGKSGIPVTFQGPVTVPFINPTFAEVPAHAVNPGANGNIPQFDIVQNCCAGIVVKNTVFTGGTNAQPNDQVQQSDITNAANPLITSQTQSEQTSLKTQIKSNEQVVSGLNHCQPNVNPDAPVGTHAKTVTVTVSVTCTEEVYETASAQTEATSLLTQQAKQDLGPAYQLDGQVAASVETSGDQFTLKAHGLWAYTFSSARLSQLATLIAGKSQVSAQALLQQQPGVAHVQFSTAGTLPSADHIQIKVQAPAVASQ